MDQTDLLSSFARPGRRRSWNWTGLWLSVSGHGLAIGLAGAIGAPSPLAAQGPVVGHQSLILVNPAPALASKLPLGSPSLPRTEARRPRRADTPVEVVREIVPEEAPPAVETPPEAEPPAPAPPQAGDPNGSPSGVPEGMENGSEDGVAGGMPWGQRGGQPGGTGTDLVPASGYDRGPRLVRQPKPPYPHDAFIRKIEGEVLLEVLIDASGRVVRTRVLRSIPLLDASAIQAVYEWRFEPALKQGRAVPALIRASVRFSLL